MVRVLYCSITQTRAAPAMTPATMAAAVHPAAPTWTATPALGVWIAPPAALVVERGRVLTIDAAELDSGLVMEMTTVPAEEGAPEIVEKITVDVPALEVDTLEVVEELSVNVTARDGRGSCQLWIRGVAERRNSRWDCVWTVLAV